MPYHKNKSGFDAKRTPTNLEVMWAAGIYEGEGSCVRAGHGKGSFTVSVCQKDPELLYRLQDMFGGTIALYNNDRGELASKRRFEIYAWRICGDHGRLFLAAIYPHLTARRKAQIDATPAGKFISSLKSFIVGKSVDISIVATLRLVLEDRAEEHIVARQKARVEYQKDHYAAHRVDPIFMEKRRAQTRAWRLKQKETPKTVSTNLVAIA